jgi:hemoglobin
MALTKQFYVPPGGPPQERPHPGIFVAMGEANIFQMVADFYKRLEQSPLRPLFPEDMQEASKRSAAFFVFLLGGPPLYHERYGAPRMRQRHLPFAIDEDARNIWLKCFEEILDEAVVKYSFPAEHLKSFKGFLEQFSTWMVNNRT